jgi:hypothetical protein
MPETKEDINPELNAANAYPMAVMIKDFGGSVSNQASTLFLSLKSRSTGVGYNPSLIIFAITIIRNAVDNPAIIDNNCLNFFGFYGVYSIFISEYRIFNNGSVSEFLMSFNLFFMFSTKITKGSPSFPLAVSLSF